MNPKTLSPGIGVQQLANLYSNSLKKLPVTESLYKEIISLPCHVDLSSPEQDYVTQKIGEFYNA